MSNTIELLEAIGRSASLRHASAEELVPILEQAKASETLKSAIAAGDSSLLSTEFGHIPNRTPQIANAPGHEEDEPGHERDGDEAHHPSGPDQRTPHKH